MAMLLVMGFAPRSGVGSQVGKNTGVLNPNLAGEKELLALPHLNAELVKAILDKRPFLSMAAFHSLLGGSLTKEQTAELYAKLFIPINLNAATEEEILLIPGVGKRIAHEFEEYRPYRGLAQFRREIGKYVDEKEVARLEQYVFVPINLNTASDADILSIPGVGKRLLHEFKEYRPYKSLEQFRREIGKYVDKKEVTRLETYVTLE
jgi:DNA uptake protein ComE-like DNA-binding protein